MKTVFYLERCINGLWIEDEYEVEFDFEPLVNGRFSGPPERCYPNEGGYAEAYGVVWKHDNTQEEISIDEFVKRYVAYYEIESNVKSAEDKALERINADCYEEAIIQHEAAYDAYCDLQYDRWKDDGF